MTPMNFCVWQERSRERRSEFEKHAARQRRRINCHAIHGECNASQDGKSTCFMGRYKVGLVLAVL